MHYVFSIRTAVNPLLPTLHLPILDIHINHIIQHIVFCDCLLSLGIIFSRLIHVTVYIRTIFLFITQHSSVVWIECSYSHLIYPPSFDGHVSCFQCYRYYGQCCCGRMRASVCVDMCFHSSRVWNLWVLWQLYI